MRALILPLLLLVIFLVPPVPASAVTIAELQAQLESLIAQLVALQSARQSTTTAISVGSSAMQCPSLFRDLTLDSVGEDVRMLQRFLNQNGITVAVFGPGSRGYETNTFWYGTRDALRVYQATNNLTTTGVLDAPTRAVIASRCAVTANPSQTNTTTAREAPKSKRGGGSTLKNPTSSRPTLPSGTSTSTKPTVPNDKFSLPPHNPVQMEPQLPERVQLGALLNKESTYVVNRSWSELPRRSSEIPLDANGNPDYSSGSAVPVLSGFSYGKGNVTGSDAFIIIPPTFSGDVIKVNFGSLSKLASGAEWRLKLKVGLQSDAPSGTRAQLRIGVVADKLRTEDSPWEFLSTTEVISGQTYTLSIPLGLWAFRDNLILVFEAEKVGSNNYWQGIIVDNAYLEAERPAPWNSVGRGGIYSESSSKQNQVLNVLAQIPADWHRIEVPHTVADAAANAIVLKRIQDQGKKMFLILGPSSEDYGWDLSKARYTNDPLFQQKCNTSWGAFRLSLTDFVTYEENLTKKLQTLRDAGVKIEAFDIGNELDWVCSNGDLPLNRIANQEEIDTTTRAYAKLLEHSVRAINVSYPNAITVSGLSANLIHGTGIHATGMIRTPGRVIKALSSLDGKNYLSLIDRIGMHFYPDPDNPSTIASDLVAYHSDAGSPNKPYWATEWGYAQSRFPTARGKDRYTALVEFYDAATKSHSPVVENIFFYALDDFNWGGHTLVDSNYNLLPEASKFFDRF